MQLQSSVSLDERKLGELHRASVVFCAPKFIRGRIGMAGRSRRRLARENFIPVAVRATCRRRCRRSSGSQRNRGDRET